MPRTPDPAPHGRDEHGVPLAPYGWNTDGSPRKSNRGRRAAGRPAPAPSAKPTLKTNLKDSERKSMLVDLADMFLITPLAGVSQSPALTRKLGRHADALAGDAFILAQYAPGIADALILLSKTKPKTLAWLDRAEENAPYALLAKVGIDMIKSFAQNHLTPDPRLAKAGRNLAMLRMQQMADAVNAEADRIASEAAEREENARLFNDEPTAQYAAV